MALHPNKIAKVRRAKRCCGSLRGSSSVIMSTFGQHLPTSSTKSAWLPPSKTGTLHSHAAQPANAPCRIPAISAGCPKLQCAGTLPLQPATKRSMRSRSITSPGWPGSPPGSPREEPRFDESWTELTAADAPEPGAPLVKDFPQAQLSSVTRCASALKRVELLGNHVGGQVWSSRRPPQRQVHTILVPIVGPSFVGNHIRGQHDTPAIPQTEPGELEPAKVGCAALAVIDATRHLRQRGGKDLSQFLLPGHRGSDKPQPRASNRCRLADPTQPLPSSPHAAWTPRKQPHAGSSPRWLLGYLSPGLCAACKVAPCYTPGHPWNQSITV